MRASIVLVDRGTDGNITLNEKKSETYRKELLKAIQIFGSQRQIAEEINTYIRLHKLNTQQVSQQNISNWLHRDKKIARDYPPVIEAITNGVIRASALRGDGKISTRRR
jgi:DNA-binding transcriptional regulator YdaS (Cro superfamily)